MLEEHDSLDNVDTMFDWADDYKATGVMHSKRDIIEFKAQLARVDHEREVGLCGSHSFEFPITLVIHRVVYIVCPTMDDGRK